MQSSTLTAVAVEEPSRRLHRHVLFRDAQAFVYAVECLKLISRYRRSLRGSCFGNPKLRFRLDRVTRCV